MAQARQRAARFARTRRLRAAIAHARTALLRPGLRKLCAARRIIISPVRETHVEKAAITLPPASRIATCAAGASSASAPPPATS